MAEELPEWERKFLGEQGNAVCDDGVTCDCSQPRPRKGWEGEPLVTLDGENWPLDFAARKMIGCAEKDLRDLVRILEIEPVGTLRMASYRRSGRNPRVYDGSKLVKMWQGVQDLKEYLRDG